VFITQASGAMPAAPERGRESAMPRESGTPPESARRWEEAMIEALGAPPFGTPSVALRRKQGTIVS
jgi:hypothetical protein